MPTLNKSSIEKVQLSVWNDSTERGRLAEWDIRTDARTETHVAVKWQIPSRVMPFWMNNCQMPSRFKIIPSVWIKVTHASFIPSPAWYRYILNGHAKACRDSVFSGLYLWTACTHSRSTYCQYHRNAKYSNRDGHQSQINCMSWIMIKCNQRQHF